MKITLTVCLMLLCLSTVRPQSEIPALLKDLDLVLEENDKYINQKEGRLSRLKMQLEQEVNLEKQYTLTHSIIEEYKSYISDSALVYIYRNLELCEKVQNVEWEIRTKIQYSFVLSSSGLFVESESIIKSINRDDLTDELKVNYYDCLVVLYINLGSYSNNPSFLDDYSAKVDNARDSLFYYLSPSGPQMLFLYHIKAYYAGDLEKALEYLLELTQKLSPGTHEHARKAHSLYTLHCEMGREQEGIKYLIQAVMSDVKDAVKENKALVALSIWLYEQGDINRAYRYIQFALNDANIYGARFRYYEIAQTLPIIANAFQKRNELLNNRLKVAVITISVLLLILIGLVFSRQRQMKRLDSARKILKETNTHLEEANQKQSLLNQELSEANLIKEEYIGYFLDLYSEHVSKLEDYRRMINNKIATKQFDALQKMTKQDNNETRDLYKNLDKVFLSIYPDFVNFLNSLLRPEEQFELKKNELNTELRVFALIRLGITDSNKIASFLRSSVQTVYNYRSKIKKKTISGNDDIEEKIKQIGNIQNPPSSHWQNENNI